MLCPSRTAGPLHLSACAFGASLALLSSITVAQDQLTTSEGCFYATSSGQDRRPLSPCEGHDPLGLGDKPIVVSIMRLLRIDRTRVKFIGCAGQPFRVSAQSQVSGSTQFVINYPIESANTFLAPLTHELAHVMQMQEAGGYTAALAVAKQQNRGVELGADYVTGLVFSELRNESPEFNARQFQHSASLIGLYKEFESEAHGTPDQRTAAFRVGFINYDKQSDPAKAYGYFRANLYADVVRAQAEPVEVSTKIAASESSVGVYLNKLTACDDIETLFGSLRSGKNDPECSSANDDVTVAILAKLSPMDASRICVLARPPANFLRGFHCFMPPAGSGADLTCFRAMQSVDIARYKEVYKDRFSTPVLSYLAEASQCTVSNGDSGQAQATLMSPFLAFVANFEFGFVVSLGQAQPPDSLMIHGYATTDPDMDDDTGNTTAIEFVQILAGISKATTNTVSRQLDGWTIEIDEGDEPDQVLNDSYRDAGVAAWIDSRQFDLESSSIPSVPQEEKRRILRSLQSAVGGGMKEEGFEEFDVEDDIKSAKKLAEMFDVLSKRQPYGLRKGAQEVLSKHLKVYMKFNRRYCTGSSDDGMLIVYVFALEPREGVGKDFGGIVAAIMSFGSCKSSSVKLKIYADGLLDVAGDSVFATLRKS